MKHTRVRLQWSDLYDENNSPYCFPSCSFYRRFDVATTQKRLNELEDAILVEQLLESK